MPENDDKTGTREESQVELRVLRALRDATQAAHRERNRSTALIVSVVATVFLIRQFIPPAWLLWM